MVATGSRISKKKMMEKRQRRIAWKKYNESMKQKEVYDQQRDEHIANRNAMLEKRAKQIEADRMAASLGERDKILRQKAEQKRIRVISQRKRPISSCISTKYVIVIGFCNNQCIFNSITFRMKTGCAETIYACLIYKIPCFVSKSC